MSVAAMLLSALLVLLSSQQPPATPNPPHDGSSQDDRSGKGAVLCAWHVYSTAQQVAERCHPGEDPELQRTLRKSVADIDAFIVRNNRPAVSAGQVAEIRAREFRESERWIRGKGGEVCRDPALEQMYAMVKAQGADGVAANVTELLSVPRQPVMNPCF